MMEFLKRATITEINMVIPAEYNTGKRLNMHNRPCYGLVFSFGGEICYIHNGQKVLLKENQFVFIPINTTYESIIKKSGSVGIINFSTAEPLDANSFCCATMKTPDIFEREFKIMCNAFLKNYSQNRCTLLASMYNILSIIMSDLQKNTLPFVLTSALNYIDENLCSTELSNKNIAEHLKISEVYLRKLFSKKLSTSVNKYINNKRIEKAKRLLCESHYTVTEVSELCGFSTIYYFCRLCQKTNLIYEMPIK